MTGVLVAAVLSGAAGCGAGAAARSGMSPQFPSPMVEHARAHERLAPPEGRDPIVLSGDPLPGDVSIYPAAGAGASADLLVHFHGPGFVAFLAASELVRPMTAVSVNLGSGSSAYERPFQRAGAFEVLIDTVRTLTGFDRASPPGRIYLSAFSAGYGAVRAILREDADRIAGVLLLDGLHASYVPEGRVLYEGGRIDSTDLAPFLEYARRAVRDEKRLLFTHSEIFPGTYASTTESADYLLAALDLKPESVLEWGPGGMQMISRAHRGGLTILGFAGNTAPDHVDHLHGLPLFLKMLLNE